MSKIKSNGKTFEMYQLSFAKDRALVAKRKVKLQRLTTKLGKVHDQTKL